MFINRFMPFKQKAFLHTGRLFCLYKKCTLSATAAREKEGEEIAPERVGIYIPQEARATANDTQQYNDDNNEDDA